ncbi:hypothetical protein B9T29_04515 [Acinetobacter sp. ANC 3903]|uniref:WG repeat-containing protein n=1 Tax=Acinetobacter sp. ANC 3903 TaxID=1977883 RepID=UPI000A34A327|nr:WG repeat-containing protein [Acinetobacter sp. ANC 3903]OTG63429.1 hypothetical protein B9T29_04515 [Acinetobacter sp. ANC 3903]
MRIQNLKKILVIPFLLFSSYGFSESPDQLYPIKKNNVVGFIDDQGGVFIEPTYDADEIYFLGTGRDDLINVNKDGKRGVLSSKGQLIIPTIYDNNIYSFDFNGGSLASFSINGRCGYITDQNKKMINEKYERCNAFYGNKAAVRLNQKWALINEKDELLTEFIYDEIGRFSEGLAYVSIKGKYGFIDKSGKVVIPLVHEMAMSFENGLARIGSMSSPYYFINKSGEKVFDVQFTHVYTFETEYAVIRQDIGNKELYGVIDLNGKVIIKPQYTDLKLDKKFPDLAIIADKNSKYGLMNIKTNMVVIQPKYENLSFSLEGLITFSEKRRSGLMDLNQNIILPARFDQGGLGFGANQQLSLVKVNGDLIYIDRQGNKVSDFILD